MPDNGRSGKLEHGFDHVRAVLEHALRDPAIAQHGGWRWDAKEALEWLDQLREAVRDDAR